jgi:energy-coupling factor transporter ATP-binding protein EcfA2
MSRFIKKLHLRNLLSFDDCEVELQDLNVLIGPNGAGKSNLIEAIGLLRSLVYDYPAYLGQGGGMAAWIWKGQKPGTAQVQSTLHGDPDGELVHSFRVEEGIRWEKLYVADTKTDAFTREGDQVTMPVSGPLPFAFPESVLRRFRIPSDLGPTGRTGQRIESIRIYREFRTGKNEVLRTGASSSGDGNRLEEGGQNLALVLDELGSRNRLDQIQDVLGEINHGYKKVRHKLI